MRAWASGATPVSLANSIAAPQPAQGFTVFTFGKSLAFSVTTAKLFAKAVAAIRLSMIGTGRPTEFTYLPYSLASGTPNGTT
jgi:hypothetical protein